MKLEKRPTLHSTDTGPHRRNALTIDGSRESAGTEERQDFNHHWERLLYNNLFSLTKEK